MTDRNALIETLERLRGERSRRALAEELGLSAGFLSDLYNGNREPGDLLLERLGLERRITYTAKEPPHGNRKRGR